MSIKLIEALFFIGLILLMLVFLEIGRLISVRAIHKGFGALLVGYASPVSKRRNLLYMLTYDF
jgi:hypothetical protein